MNSRVLAGIGILSILLLSISAYSQSDGKWHSLLDKELNQWDTFLSYKLQVGYDGSKPKNANGEEMEPVGMNKSGYDVFTIIEEDGELILRNSGEYYGCLITKEEFKNYHLRLKYKWGNLKWGFRKDLLKDSGVLYHSIGWGWNFGDRGCFHKSSRLWKVIRVIFGVKLIL